MHSKRFHALIGTLLVCSMGRFWQIRFLLLGACVAHLLKVGKSRSFRVSRSNLCQENALETILLNLTPTDLTRCMRVSKTWKQIIEQSQRLQRARVASPSPTAFTDNQPKKWLLQGIPS